MDTSNAMSDRPTPETDGMEFKAIAGMMPPYDTVPSRFARRLEHERDEAREQVIAERALAGQRGRLYETAIRQLKVFQTKVDELNDKLRRAEAEGCKCDVDWPEEHYEIRQQLIAERFLADRLAGAIQNHFDVDEDMWATDGGLKDAVERLQLALAEWKDARGE